MASDAATDKIKENLLWMAAHPGEWLNWTDSSFYPVSARGIGAPSFERCLVSRQGSKDGYGPHKGWKGGLWVRYVPCNVTHRVYD